MEPYVCLHGHYYQPPRANPWTDDVDLQPSASPFPDWNARITREAYAPNAWARVIDASGRIRRIASNYERTSFDFGPTLLEWLERHARGVHDAIREADRASRRRFSGHGSAMAQSYHHAILPLLLRRDKATEVRWAVRDFEHRFGRPPEGMWLPETAVDIETLDVLAEAGIRFTVLAPHQAARVRPLGASGQEWIEATADRLDTTRAYRQRLPSGRSIALFFYHGPISHAVAFEGILKSGHDLARRLVDAAPRAGEAASLVHIATDGETYGHHHKYGDMALAVALDAVESGGARLTNYGEFLERHPPAWEVEVRPATSWSCTHGVERWRSDCGCNVGHRPGWTQAWRRPLREALEGLQLRVDAAFDARGPTYLRDPWAARDDYIELLLDRAPARVDAFFARHGVGGRNEERTRAALLLLEMERQALRMFTSCGWFFDDPSGLETTQILRYAARAAEICREVTGIPVEEDLLRGLARAKSNIPEEGDARRVYERQARPARTDLPLLGARYAVAALFDDPDDRVDRAGCRFDRRRPLVLNEGGRDLYTVTVRVTRHQTWESQLLGVAALRLSDGRLLAASREHAMDNRYDAPDRALVKGFAGEDDEGVLKLFRECYPTVFGMTDLTASERLQVLGWTLEPVVRALEQNAPSLAPLQPLLREVKDLPPPEGDLLEVVILAALKATLRNVPARGLPDPERLRTMLADLIARSPVRGPGRAREVFQGAVPDLAARLSLNSTDAAWLQGLATLVTLLRSFSIYPDVFDLQNAYAAAAALHAPPAAALTGSADPAALAWRAAFRTLGESLGFAEAFAEGPPGPPSAP